MADDDQKDELHPLVKAGMPQHVLARLEELGQDRAEHMLTMGLLPEGWRGHLHDWLEHRRKARD